MVELTDLAASHFCLGLELFSVIVALQVYFIFESTSKYLNIDQEVL